MLATHYMSNGSLRLNIDGLGHKPSNSEFKKKKKFHKMTRGQVSKFR